MTDLREIQPKPNDLVLQQYQDRYAADCERNAFWHSPENWYRWLVLLDCGCVTEVLTREDQAPPTEHLSDGTSLGKLPVYKKTWVLHPPAVTLTNGRVYPHDGPKCVLDTDPGKPCPGGFCYPKGHLWCAAHGGKLPWREITEWLHRGRTRQFTDPPRPYSPWTVKLSCGHCAHTHSDLEWSPGIPPNPDTANLKAAEETLTTRRHEADDDLRQFFEEQIKHKGFLVSSPPMSGQCNKCAYLRRIVDYRMIGRLASHPAPARQPRTRPRPTPEETEARNLRRLKKIESDLQRLHAEADELRRTVKNGGPDNRAVGPA
jgi:hypothetical protein